MTRLNQLIAGVAAAICLMGCQQSAEPRPRPKDFLSVKSADTLLLTAASPSPVVVAPNQLVALDLPSDYEMFVGVRDETRGLVYLHMYYGEARLWPEGEQPARLVLDPREATADLWTDGERETVPAFLPGRTQTLILSDNLETEPANALWIEHEVMIGE